MVRNNYRFTFCLLEPAIVFTDCNNECFVLTISNFAIMVQMGLSHSIFFLNKRRFPLHLLYSICLDRADGAIPSKSYQIKWLLIDIFFPMYDIFSTIIVSHHLLIVHRQGRYISFVTNSVHILSLLHSSKKRGFLLLFVFSRVNETKNYVEKGKVLHKWFDLFW